MNIALGSDHAGFEYKTMLKDFLQTLGHVVLDYGTFSKNSADYPDFAVAVAHAVAAAEAHFGILVCGSGIGVSITANKVIGIRAANCVTEEMAGLARQHNNANVLTLGQRLVGGETAQTIVRTFLSTPFEGGRHTQRVEKIHTLTGR
jgi:ribose 5-phosphate isomerase B